MQGYVNKTEYIQSLQCETTIWSLNCILPQDRGAKKTQLSVKGVLSLRQKQMKGTYGFIGKCGNGSNAKGTIK